METCKWCDGEAVRKQGSIMLCMMHYRFSTMRTRAKRDGKARPTYDELERLFAALDPPMVCPGCGRVMVWLRSEDSSRCMTLQHDDDGRFRLLCMTCNSRHNASGGDAVYATDMAVNTCRRCGRTVLASVCPSSPQGGDWEHRAEICKACMERT